jgi:hypothetical protein
MFFKDLAQYLSRKKDEDIEDGLQIMYSTYFQPSNFYYVNDNDTILASLSQYKNEEKWLRMEMLAELLYQDALKRNGGQKIELLDKSLAVYKQLDVGCSTFSFERKNKIQSICLLIEELK